MNKRKIRILLVAITITIICVIYLVGMPFVIKNNISQLMKKGSILQQGLYTVRNWKVYGLDVGKNKYSNLVNNKGIGTGYIYIEGTKKYNYSISVGLFCYSGNNQKVSVKLGRCKEMKLSFSATMESQTFVAPKDGTYKVELWGAGGGNAHALGIKFDKGGKGAYVSGDITLKKGDALHVYVGSRGEDGEIIEDDNRLTSFYYPSTGGLGGYNGGGKGFDDPQTDAGGGGGGATDIRITPGKWNDFSSLKSRLMVAGGGGGSSRYYSKQDSSYKKGQAGSGGILNGKNALNLIEQQKESGHGSTQTTGYKFGIGENGDLCMTSANGAGGGAGGYFGSKSGACGINFFDMPTGAGGASSYVSGCKGCNAIDKNSTENSIKFTNQPIHYSGKKFTNIIMKSGDEKMPNPFGGVMTGNRDDGYARITFIK